MEYFKYIYYFLAIFPILFEIEWIGNYNDSKTIYEKCKKNKMNTWTPEMKTFYFQVLFYFIWCFIGLFTFQWYIYILLVIFIEIPKPTIFTSKLGSIIDIIIILFLIINTFHLHFNPI